MDIQQVLLGDISGEVLNSKPVSRQKGEKVVKYLKEELLANEVDPVCKH